MPNRPSLPSTPARDASPAPPLQNLPSGLQDHIFALLCSILEQAVADYRNLVRLGYVANGHLTEKGQGITDTTAKAYMLTTEIQDLLAFFYSPEFEHLCEDVLRIPIDPVAVRWRLGITF